MKCPNPDCNAEVKAEDKFCGECGKPLRQEIEPKWKWESMIVSLVLIFIFGVLTITSARYAGQGQFLAFLLLLGFPATIYLMYKERTAKIKYGLAWILFPILMLLFSVVDNYSYRISDIFVLFIVLAVPAIVIDIFMVKKYLQK